MKSILSNHFILLVGHFLVALFTITGLCASAQGTTINDKGYRIYRDVDDHYYHRVYLQLYKKNYTEALYAADILRNMCGGCAKSHALLTIVLSEMGEKEKAAKHFEYGKKLCHNCAEVYYEVANYKAYKNNFTEAYSIMNGAIKKDSVTKKAAGAYYFRALIEWQEGNSKAAYEDNIKAYKLDSSIQLALIHSLWYDEKIKDTALVLETLNNIKFTDTIDTKFAACFLEQKANVYLEIKKYNEAIAESGKALYFDSTLIGAYITKGLAEAYSGKNNEAVVSIDKALSVAPENTYAWNNRGFVKLYAGMYNEALKDLDKCLALDSSFNYAWNNKGYTFYKLGGKENLQKALSYYNKAIEVSNKTYKPYWEYKDEVLAALKKEQ